jgi:uncharacterized protein YjbJ (UPF0337 family)
MGKDSSEIRREIEQTRARMGDTVEALGYKADVPSRVKEAVHDKVDTVKGTIGGVVDGVKDALGGATGKVGNALGGAKDTVSGKVGDVTSSLTSNVSDGVGGIADKMPSGADVKNAAQRGVGIVAENPLGLALGALAVGFLAGLVTPVTDYEREKVGPIRDDLLDRAQSVGSDVIEHGKQVLQETVQSAVQTAQQSAQTHSKQVVSEATGSAEHGQSANGANGAETTTSSRYGVMLDDAELDTLEPGAPGTASP